MKKTVVVYGSSTGTCQSIAETIASKLGVEALDVTNFNADVVAENDNLLIGTSTWGAGKTVAVFGCGDAESYSDTFCGAMAELYNAAKESGAKMVGEVSTEDYSFDDSEAVVDGKFVGLALDDVNEDDKTEGRIDAWLGEIKPAL